MFPKFKEILNSGFSYRKSLERENISQESVNLLREKIKDLKVVPKSLTDKQLLRFLVVYKDNFDKAAELMEKYYSLRAGIPEIFSNRDALSEEIQKCFDTIFYVFLPVTPDNELLVYQGLRDVDYRKYDYEAFSKVSYMLYEAYTYYHGPFTGALLLFSLKGGTIRHVLKSSLKSMRKSANFFEQAIPFHAKKIHIFNTISAFDIIVSLVKPFLQSDIFERIQFHHGDINLENFHETEVPRSHLPKEYGGTLGSMEELHQETKKLLLDMRDYFVLEEMQSNFEFDDYIKEHPDEVHHSD